MLFFIAVIVAVCTAAFLRKPLKKYPLAFYFAAIIISAAVSFFDFRNTPAFLNNYVIVLFSRGAFAAGLWAVVMWTGALPNGSGPIKALMSVRGELSILAALLTLGHNIGFGRIYFVRMFTDPDSLSAQQLAAGVVSIIMLAIMLPLTVMSFQSVRRKIKPKIWKRIQRSAYVFYALIYTHVMILNVPFAIFGRSGYLLNIAVYSVVFIGYAVCRIRKQILIRKKPKNKTALNFCSGAASLILCTVIVTAAVPKTNAVMPQASLTDIEDNSAETPSDTTSSPVPETNGSSGLNETSSNTAGSSVPESGESSNSGILPAESSSQVTEPENISDISSISENIIDTSAALELHDPEPENESPSSLPQSSFSKEKESEYIYNNGVYTASAYGYDGDITVSVTVENDRIISITADSEESDLWYFDSAADTVISQIISEQNIEVDAVSGATFSSKGIMSAVENALDSAKKR